jgi:hypothetical protein
MRDTLMLARGVDAVVQCPSLLADWLDGPTVRRGDPLDGFVAAAPLRSLPHLLGWTLQSLPAAPPLRRAADPDERVGWFSDMPPPDNVPIERDPAEIVRCRHVLGNDIWPTHLAARLGIPTTLTAGPHPDWLWGPDAGPSPWYDSLKVKL